jgi:hypothetical protein
MRTEACNCVKGRALASYREHGAITLRKLVFCT